ncbi:MAG TPA: hypothetical protein PKN80_08500 [bacterium]|nr:hypothetical protein [bacterium]
MAGHRNDIKVLRELAKQYAEVAALPIQEERRQLWSEHNSLRPTRVLVIATFGMWNVWCREIFNDGRMECRDPFYRYYERILRMQLFQHSIGDDFILEPWINHRAAVRSSGGFVNPWGVEEKRINPGVEGGAFRFDPPLKEWSDLEKLRPLAHQVDEVETGRGLNRLREAVGDILPVNLDRTPVWTGWLSDISTSLGRMRGLDQVMIDMYEAPEKLHGLLAFMRDHILAQQAAAEAAGDFSLTSGHNQCHIYSRELEAPRANSGPRRRRQLWGYFAAQEFTLVSPAMHEEFMLRYQRPIMENFGLTAYGCCEDLTRKIGILRQVSNLRVIAVAPRADLAACARAAGTDYVLSWRPNPADMLCCGFDPDRVRRIITAGLESARGCRVHIHLKDIETLEGDPDRLRRWVQVVRSACDRVH